MIYSMTGYGESMTNNESLTVTTSIKTVNHRYLDIKVRGLEDFRKLEAKSEKLIKSYFSRGRIDGQVDIIVNSEGKNLNYDLNKAKVYYQILSSLAKELKLDERPTLSHIIKLGGVFDQEDVNESEIWPLLKESFSQSAKKVLTTRRNEGEALKEDLIARIEKLCNNLEKIEKHVPQVKKEYVEKLKCRVKELLEDDKKAMDENRLEEEAILYAEKSDITEEITRLYSHLEASHALLANETSEGEAVGSNLDFLAQEMQREVNTIGSKTSDVAIKKRAVEMKSQIKKIREQVRNIE